MRARRLIFLLISIVLCAAGLFLVFALHDGSSGSAGAQEGVRINEVMTSNKGAVPDENGDYPDWVEFHNPTEQEIDVSGYGLSDDKLSAAQWVFPTGTTIPAGGYLVVYCSGDAANGPYHAGFRLSATDELILITSTGRGVDSMQLRGVAAGCTLGLDESGAWVEFTEPSPGYPNTPEGAAAYRESLNAEAEDLGVRINEFMASNATTIATKAGDYADWIELYNTTSSDVDLSGCGLSDKSAQPMKWQFPEGTVIPGNGYLLVFCTGQDGLIDGELHAPLGLRAYEEEVVLSDRSGRIVEQVAYSRQESDFSMARAEDGSFTPTARPTPGHPNTDEGFAAFEAMSAFGQGPLILSEAMAGNSSLLPQEDGSYPDWIELHNNGAEPIPLSGYALSDNPNNPARWVFPEGTSIDPGGYITVLATGSSGADSSALAANFALNSEGDMVLLFSPEGRVLDKLRMGPARSGMSVGRESGKLRYYEEPTPGGENGPGAEGVTSEPGFEPLPGIYDGPVTVALTAAPGETIHYTLDCTTPTADSPVYTGPITVSENTVIRAVSVRDGYVTGYTVSGTFLLRTDGADHSLPIAALVTDPDHLWDGKTGIYTTGDSYLEGDDVPLADALLSANYYQGKQSEAEQAKWERPANFSIFGDESGQEVFSQNVSIRIGGAYGRSRAQKAFNITAREEYGDNRMAYPFFENRPFAEYKSLVLRSGAQDQNRAKIRDELASGLLEGTDVRFLYQAYKPYVLYLNGEYWGVYFLKEKRSRFFVAQHEGTEDNFNMNIGKSSTMVSHGTNDDWLALMDYVRSHDLTVREHYDYVDSQMDMGSFMDYMICEIYVGNTDHGNIQYYKLPGEKWKWIYYDFCWGFASPDHNTLSFRRGSVPAASDLFNALLKNSDFRDAFLRRFAELMETVYAPERVLSLIDELYATVEPEIAREREKFNQSTFMGVANRKESLGTYEGFQTQIGIVKKFAEERPGYMKQFIQSEFGLSDGYMEEVFG